MSGLKHSCDVCFEAYELDVKEPYLLKCGHTFCLDCLKHIRKEVNGGWGVGHNTQCP